MPREAYVQKANFACSAVTGAYIIYGYCHIHPEGTLETTLRGADTFMPITHATISLVGRPNVQWQRDVVIVNRRLLEAMYLVSPPKQDV
jgi:hypothetical protein